MPAAQRWSGGAPKRPDRDVQERSRAGQGERADASLAEIESQGAQAGRAAEAEGHGTAPVLGQRGRYILLLPIPLGFIKPESLVNGQGQGSRAADPCLRVG